MTAVEPGGAFPRAARLLTAADFAAVLEASGRASSRFFSAKHRSTGQPARLGLAVAKKSIRLATGRNRLKRLIREHFRHHRDLLEGLDLMVRVRPEASQRDNRELRADLHRLWQNLAAARTRAAPPRTPADTP